MYLSTLVFRQFPESKYRTEKPFFVYTACFDDWVTGNYPAGTVTDTSYTGVRVPITERSNTVYLPKSDKWKWVYRICPAFFSRSTTFSTGKRSTVCP
jgi:hypothetical protein